MSWGPHEHERARRAEISSQKRASTCKIGDRWHVKIMTGAGKPLALVQAAGFREAQATAAEINGSAKTAAPKTRRP